jgi:peptide/nickel transport system substrate-binding protein
VREGVAFHDGSEFDAGTVEIALSQPTPNLLANLGAFKGMAILAEGGAEQVDLNTEAIGTGPFTLEAVNPGDIQLAAFEDYWGEGPFVDEVEFRFVSEPTTALTGLRTGDIDWTDNVPPQQIASLSEDKAVTLRRFPASTTGICP